MVREGTSRLGVLKIQIPARGQSEPLPGVERAVQEGHALEKPQEIQEEPREARYRKRYAGNSAESSEYDFLPPTFLMPSEYVIFYEEFKRQTSDKYLWIMKPVING